jgi:glycerate dehydrogenase
MHSMVVLDGHTLNPGDLGWGSLAALGSLSVFQRTKPDAMPGRCRAAVAVFTNKVEMNAATLDACPALRYIGVLATGCNVVDLGAARACGITVTNVPGYSTASVAQHAFALLLELTNQVGLHSAITANGGWARCPDFSFHRTTLVELDGLILGVIGCGAIGQAVARIGAVLGMKILGHSRNRPTDWPSAFEWTADRDRVFCEADVLTLHCPLTDQTRHLVNARSLGLMKPSAFLVNTGRGALVDEPALAAALNDGRLAGAGLDVLSTEPPSAGNPLLSAPNCLVTPHHAWATRAARQRLMDVVVANYKAFLAGEPRNVVS